MTMANAPTLAIIDTSCANLASLKFAVERLGYGVTVTADPAHIERADKVFLPGVGSAQAAMQQIAAKQLTECIRSLRQPVLGICLGMQLLTQSSQETGQSEAGDAVPCLGPVPARVTALQSQTLRLPHMGWNTVKTVRHSPLFHAIPEDSYFYFVHGFCVAQGGYTLATCNYTQTFSAAVQQDNFMGVQFHPERSSEAGAKLLRNFIELV